MTTLGNFKIISLIGEGSSSKVKLAQSIKTGDFVALKIIKKSKLETNPKLLKQITREIKVLTVLHHPSIISLHKILESNQKIYLVLDYINGGDLSQKLKYEGHFDENTSRDYFQQIINAVSYMHSQNVIHRDLKLENILIDLNTSKIKITDFGLSILTKTSSKLLKAKCGTPYYAAPEMFGESPYEGKPVDTWSCGVILYIMLTGVFPFEGSTIQCLAEQITHANVYYPSKFSEDLVDLFKHIFIINPKNRYTANDIMKHPWLQKNYQSLLDHSLKNNSISNNDLDISSASSADCKGSVFISLDENAKVYDINNTAQENQIQESDNDISSALVESSSDESGSADQLDNFMQSKTFQSLAEHIDLNDVECNPDQKLIDSQIEPQEHDDDIPTAFELIAKICQVDVGKLIQLCLKAKKDGKTCREEYDIDACSEHLLFSPQPFTSDDSKFIAFSTNKSKTNAFNIIDAFLDSLNAIEKNVNRSTSTFTVSFTINTDVISLNIEIIPIDTNNVIIYSTRHSGTPANFSRILRAIKTRIDNYSLK